MSLFFNVLLICWVKKYQLCDTDDHPDNLIISGANEVDHDVEYKPPIKASQSKNLTFVENKYSANRKEISLLA